MVARPVLVSVVQAGRRTYQQGLELQRQLIERHADPKVPAERKNSLIIIEHEPVYTIGIRTAPYPDQEIQRLKELGADFHKTDRGGLITFHGPGQLVCYPILNLKDFDCTVKKYVCLLEKTVIRMCGEYGVQAKTTEDTGIWVGNSKICALGIHASRFITSHGLALNCNTELSWFRNIVPCGLVGKGVTSLTHELSRNVEIKEVVPHFLDAFSETFNCKFESDSET